MAFIFIAAILHHNINIIAWYYISLNIPLVMVPFLVGTDLVGLLLSVSESILVDVGFTDSNLMSSASWSSWWLLPYTDTWQQSILPSIWRWTSWLYWGSQWGATHHLVMTFSLNVKMTLVVPVISTAQESLWHDPLMLSDHAIVQHVWAYSFCCETKIEQSHHSICNTL